MVRVTVELDDEVFERLKARAEGVGQSVEPYLAIIAAREADNANGIDDDFVADVHDMINTYRPVLRRLAE